MKSYRALALLLRYPQPEWLEALDEVEALLHAERHRNRRDPSRGGSETPSPRSPAVPGQ